MKIYYTFLLTFLLCMLLHIGCDKRQDELPTDATRIEGHWRSMLPAHPDWQYDFDRGILTQSLEDFGAPLVQYQFPYATRADTVTIGGDATNGPRSWKVYFYCDSIVKVTNTTPGQIVAPVIWLQRR